MTFTRSSPAATAKSNGHGPGSPGAEEAFVE
jgi:hypothetical protein